MKKLFVFSVLLCAFLQNYAQIAVGSKYVNGAAGFSIQSLRNTSNQKSYQLQSNVNVRYATFKKENIASYWSFGYAISQIYLKSTQSGNSWQKTNDISQNLSLGYGKQKWFSLNKIHRNLYLTLQGGLSGNAYFGTNTDKTQNTSNTDFEFRGIGANFDISPSLALFLNDKWLLQTTLGHFNTGYSLNLDTVNGESRFTHSFSISPNFNPSGWNIGISYFWNKKSS